MQIYPSIAVIKEDFWQLTGQFDQTVETHEALVSLYTQD